MGVAALHLDIAMEMRVEIEAQKKREGDKGPWYTGMEGEDPRKYKVSRIRVDCCR